MFRTHLTPLLGVAALLGATFSTAGCLKPSAEEAPEAQAPQPVAPPAQSPPLPEGTYQVQSMTYDDASDLYGVFLLNPPPGHKPLHQVVGLRMARLSDEDVAAGKGAQLVVDAEGPVAQLPPDFQIALTHNVTEERVNPNTGKPEVTVVRQESSMWSPFMVGMTGAMVGNMLFAPRYYYPPPYAGGGVMGGFGGAGNTRASAGQDFQSKHGKAPQAARLSQSGYSKAPAKGLKSTGSGAGSSRLKTKPTAPRPKARPFGGGRGFGRRR